MNFARKTTGEIKMTTAIIFMCIGIVLGILGVIGLNKLESKLSRKKEGFPDSRGRK